MQGSFLGYLLLFQALFYTVDGRNRMLLAPEVEMQAANSRQPVLLTPKAAPAENGAATGSGSPTLVSLVVESQQGVNVTYLNLTLTSSGPGSSRIVSLEPLSSVLDPASNSSTEGQGTTAVAESIEERNALNIAVPSPEIELASVESILAPSVAELDIEEVVEIIRQEPDGSNDTFVRLVPSPEITALPGLNLEAEEVAAVPSPEPEPEPNLIIEPPVATIAVIPTTAAATPAAEPPASEPSIEVPNTLTAGALSENPAPAPVAEVVQQTPSLPPPVSPPPVPPPPVPPPPVPPPPVPPPPVPPPPVPPPPVSPPPPPPPVSASEIEGHDQNEQIFDEKTAPKPEVQPTSQATEEDLAERISQSLAGISDTIYGITQVLQVTSGR